MSPRDETERDAILVRLAVTRAEIQRLLEPVQNGADAEGATPSSLAGGFPRSRTMQMLMSGKGLGAMGATAAGLLIARPALAWRLIRLLPTSAVTRMVMGRILGAMRTKRTPD